MTSDAFATGLSLYALGGQRGGRVPNAASVDVADAR
jgi:hypothetical protein